jgi:hypothetical protein
VGVGGQAGRLAPGGVQDAGDEQLTLSWPTLSPHIKAAILALVQAAR